MSGQTLARAVVGLLVGTALGAGAGLLGGLAYTTLAGTSSFEGYSGFVVVAWMLVIGFLGAIAGTIVGARWGRQMR